jgi:uncharacterized protein YdeI (BOF family)
MRREMIAAAIAASLFLAVQPALAQGGGGPSGAAAAVQSRYPNAVILAVRRAPNGDFVVTVRLGNQVRRVRVDGETGQIK